MESAVFEKDGKLVEFLFEYVSDRMFQWSEYRRPCDVDVTFAVDASENPVFDGQVEHVELDKRIMIHEMGRHFLARIGYSNFRHCFLVSKYAEVTKEGARYLE